ncbi:MAG: nicotinate (nicotinamide) nucleotide adenylyltransferase [Bacteroidaceae bacterium]|jgi:nicotinate-nucleotide adenylyltransferase
MIRTGIFGGSFNPIHKAHVALAENICRTGMVDEIWLLVSPQNPLKKDLHLMNDNLRLEMAQQAVKGHPMLQVSDFEFHLPRPSYMYHTLEELQKTFPEHVFTLIIGADNWLNFDQWFHADEILKHHDILIYPRKGFDINTALLPNNVHLLEKQKLFPVSSTEVREKLEHGENVSKWVDKKVEQILKQKNTSN